MKVGRNDPCPCGSGKKYKNCCLKTNDANLKIKSIVNQFYGVIKSINNDLIAKSNKTDYRSTSFIDAMDLAITSNTLSLIKGYMQNNCCSITNALNMRNILEHYVLVLMDEAGDITESQKELFNVQYSLIEYQCYKDKIINITRDIIGFKELNKEYHTALNLFAKYGYNESKVQKFMQTRAPFLCQERFNFNKLIKKYLPKYEKQYIYLSMLIHPSSYYATPTNEEFIAFTLDLLYLITQHYGKRNIQHKELSFYQESVLIYGPEELSTPSQKLYDIQQAQWSILLDIANWFHSPSEKYNYVEKYLKELACIVHDINTDSQLGYTENPKLKFKVIVEFFACFDRIYFNPDIEKGQASYFLMDAHEVYKSYETNNQPVPNEVYDNAFSFFNKIYPNNNVDKKTFILSFKKLTGFLLDENANAISYSTLVSEYLSKIYLDEYVEINNEKINLLTLNKILYSESQFMSHGCGYLYFANQGAWMEDLNVIWFLDSAIIYMLEKFKALWNTYSILDNSNTNTALLFNEKHKEMCKLIKIKNEITRANPRVLKIF